MAFGYLTRNFSTTPTNADKFTISFWIKYAHTSDAQIAVSNMNTAGFGTWVELRSDGKIGFIEYVSSGTVRNFETERIFSDTSSWYHIVIAGDSTQASDSNKMKFYANGEQLIFSTSTYAATNTDYRWNKQMDSGTPQGHQIGRSTSDGSNFVGYLAHMHNIDGTQYAASDFGETDSTTGGWKPKLNPSVTYGTNGWFLKFENSGAMGTDSSGNSNTFTLTGDVNQSVTTPSNDFCVLNFNECYNTQKKDVLHHGNTTWADPQSTSDGPKGAVGTLATAKGKWYFEAKHIEGMYTTVGISKAGSLAPSKMINTTYRSPFIQGNEGDGFGFQAGTASRLIQRGDNTEVAWNDGSGSNIASVSANDILMIAYDLDAGKIWWGRNGTWNTVPGSSTATSSSDIASGNYAHKTWTANGEFFRPAVSVYQRTYGSSGANPNTIQCNFGEGRFANTAVSSGNADSQGNGTFEYAPPTNFLAVCTKNIKDFG
tara:strand:+ start:7027 stop:8481 length:1455 start_codon:yes stop_codon:yes gene_type:complete